MNDGPHPASNGGLPLVCTLRPDDGSARLRRWQRLHETAAPSVHLVDGELEVRYQPGHGVRDELRSLAAAEQVCCSFVLWAVTEDAGHLVLRVTAPPETPHAVEPIAIMFGATTANRTWSQ
ncbi:MAG: hypothetical protein ACRDTT_17870 [Pseudonocardiaceae bacterium]